MNIVILKGRLTKNPEIRTTTTGTKVCSFSIAINRRFSRENEADFINCTAWRQTAEFIHKYFEKGQEICISGSLQVRKWEDNDGKTRYSTYVIVDNAEFCGSKKDREKTINADVASFDEVGVANIDTDDMTDDLPF